MSNEITLQKFVAHHEIMRDQKSIRRALRRKFHDAHEHNARWTFAKSSRVHTFLCEMFAIDLVASRVALFASRASAS
ncbi:hypothetical protein LCGC14_2966780 [marine sediment metagenome]|uniref:Uncharacterized protein n=1 Tax=marine sediment metagenome TaxID=412755 RepID=A0A0F9A1W0_9ZZZZ